MAADAGIFQQYLKPVRSVADYQGDMDKQEQNALTLAASRITNQTAQQTLSDDQAARQASIASGGDQNKLVQLLQQGGNYKAAQAVQKNLFDSQKTQAETGLATAHAGNFKAQTTTSDYDLKIKQADQSIKDISSFSTPQEAVSHLNESVKSGLIPAEKAQMILQGMPQDPTQFPAWQLKMLRGIMSAKDQMAQISPDANAKLSADTSRANNAATVGASISNNRATIAKDYTIAGIGPDGAPSASVESMAQQIAAGKLPPISGFALARPQGQSVMARVAAINPDYDATTYGAKVKAAKDFTSGTQGNAMRSFAVAGQHLDQLGQLVDALDNGNMQIVNKIGNIYSQQTGSPKVTNFDAAKDVVSKEVIKAIVAGGGGVSERQELSNLMGNAKSPAQLKGVISQYRNLMAAQHDALLQQRRSAGLADSTMPNYTQPEAAPPKTVNFGDLK